VARRELASLIEALRQGLSLPLPVAIKTSLAWLSAKPDQQETEATKVFEGDGYRSHGEVEGNPYLQRAYPTFEDLVSAHTPSGGFPEWTERLYQPLVAAQLMTLEDEE
jgi:exodeoxyribonuclease V gamma subunit